MKVITWTDLEGRYRVTSPAYDDDLRPIGESEAKCLDRVWAVIVAEGRYGIALDHPHFYVENAVLRAKLDECCGAEFRYVGRPDHNGERSGIGGAWEMDTDGTPKVNMEKARSVHMDKIRIFRDAELVKTDIPFNRAVEDGDTEAQVVISRQKQLLRDIPATFDLITDADSPTQLHSLWPLDLPGRGVTQ